MTSAERLSGPQRALLDGWLPGWQAVADHSWGLVGTTVLEIAHEGSRLIAKAGDERDHHIARELRAHREWLTPWTSQARAPGLLYGDFDNKLLVTEFLPGRLVEGTVHERRPDTYRQAGVLLAQLHAQLSVVDHDYEARARAKALAWLDAPHRISPGDVARLRETLDSWPAPATTLVPTHGDCQPRNWLVHEDLVSVIDFGRSDLRPAATDLTRLAAQQFRDDPALEEAFLEGYGGDPREPQAWLRDRIREAIGTAAWAHKVGDESFERQGLRMIAEALDAAADRQPPP